MRPPLPKLNKLSLNLNLLTQAPGKQSPDDAKLNQDLKVEKEKEEVNFAATATEP